MSLIDARTKAAIVKSNPNMGVYLLLQKLEKEFEQKHEKLEEEFKNKIQLLLEEVQQTLSHVKLIQKGDTPRVGIDFDQPEDGYTPSKEDLLNLIRPLIPKVKDGRTPTASEIYNIIQPYLPKEVDVQGIVGLVLTKLEGSIPKAETIVAEVMAKINQNKIEISDIEGLEKRLSVINKNISDAKRTAKQQTGGGSAGGGMPNWVDKAFTGDGVTTQFTLDYKVAGNGGAIITIINGQVQELSTHYSVSNNSGGAVLTFTTAPFNDSTIYVQHARA